MAAAVAAMATDVKEGAGQFWADLAPALAAVAKGAAEGGGSRHVVASAVAALAGVAVGAHDPPSVLPDMRERMEVVQQELEMRAEASVDAGVPFSHSEHAYRWLHSEGRGAEANRYRAVSRKRNAAEHVLPVPAATEPPHKAPSAGRQLKRT